MTQMETAPEHAPQAPGTLGVGRLLSVTFAIFLQRFVLFVGIAVVMNLAFYLVFYGLLGSSMFMQPDQMFSTSSGLTAFFVSTFGAMLINVLLAGILTVAAYDAHQRRPIRLGLYFQSALAVVVPLLVMGLVSSIGIALGLMLLIVPGLILAVMWSVMTPAIVIDKAGFGGLKRSQVLTKGYRWPILGFLVVVYVIIFVVNALLGSIFGFGIGALAETPSGISLYLFQAATNAVMAAWGAVAVVVLYARLKELKEGLGMDDLAAIFD